MSDLPDRLRTTTARQGLFGNPFGDVTARATANEAADLIEKQTAEIEHLRALAAQVMAWLPTAKARQTLLGDSLDETEQQMIAAAETWQQLSGAVTR